MASRKAKRTQGVRDQKQRNDAAVAADDGVVTIDEEPDLADDEATAGVEADDPVRMTRPDEAVFTTEVPAHTMWERRCATAPLWMQRVAMKSRVLAFLLACVVAVVMAVLILSGIYVATTVIGAFIVPGLPEMIATTSGASLQEIKTDNDAFMFMVVLPAVFILMTWAVAVGLCMYTVIRTGLRYVVSMLSCALVSKDVVSRMYHTRRAASDFQRSSFRGKHIVDVVDSWSTKA